MFINQRASCANSEHTDNALLRHYPSPQCSAFLPSGERVNRSSSLTCADTVVAASTPALLAHTRIQIEPVEADGLAATRDTVALVHVCERAHAGEMSARQRERERECPCSPISSFF